MSKKSQINSTIYPDKLSLETEMHKICKPNQDSIYPLHLKRDHHPDLKLGLKR